MKNYLLKSLLFSIVLITSARAEKISYTLSMPEPHTHYFEVEMRIENVSTDSVVLKMATWTPGSYLIREYSKNVETVTAASTSGKEVPIKKITKNTWVIYPQSKKGVVVSYRVYAYELSVRHSFLDNSHAYINGTTLFMFIDNKLDLSSTLSIKPHESFKKISTGLDPVSSDNPWVLKAKDYDELVDCPIEIGNHLTFEFEAAGVLHQVAMYGEGNFNVEKIKRDFTTLIEECTRIFGENPNERYVFIIHNLTRGGGGLEHMNSTSIQVNRWTYEGSSYLGFLSLVTHEYFHLWNVKRIRPRELVFYDYENENYTDLLWVMEGFTSYYDELLLARTGFYSPVQYINKLGRGISSIESQPGNRVQPLSKASFDAWIKAYRSNENSYNTEISYYSKGALAGLVVDHIIMKETQGEKNLDDLMKLLYERFYKEKQSGFNHDELVKAVNEITNADYTDFFNRYIKGTEAIPYADFLDATGLELMEEPTEHEVELGAFLNQSGEKLMVRTVKRNTSAYHGGLNVEDEIIAANGFRVDKDELDNILSLQKVGDTLSLLVARDGLINELSFPLEGSTSKRYNLFRQNELSEAQEKAYRIWLGIREE